MANELHDFDKAYEKGHTPWDSGVPCLELVRVVNAGLLPGRKLLELGCGTGTNAVELARRGYKVTAADFVTKAVERAKLKAEAARVEIDFRVADVIKDDLGGPFDVIFDRGVYHHIRRVDLAAFLERLSAASRKGTRWLTLAGHAGEVHQPGPPTVSEAEFRAELGTLFQFIEVREFRFGTDSDDFRPLAWSILMERK
ncbi:MAG: methyltransferase domain-containing protein [Planctomycetes bacterium]|nr:methyltransferase domain-containing protein [Planctomycetota bacterium]